jgi:hypothetical protein
VQGGRGSRGSWWRVVAALVAFLLWAHPSFVGLPYAALLFLVPPVQQDSRAPWTFALAGFVGAVSAGLLVLTSADEGRLGAVTSAFIVLVTAAFVLTVLLQPRRFLRMGVRAVLLGMAATLVLVQVIWGTSGIAGLHWEVMRGASGTMRIVVAILPQWFGLYEPAVRIITLSWPIVLGLQGLAGLALAWHLHRRTVGVTPEHKAQPGAPDLVRDAAPLTT